ncbi:MAG: bifunctional phosphoribosyl-AMP cyclohydrolase/phosphoribosyl-ATP diphosphatase HisIE [Chloroflexota bacterium]|nr:bifunctional phosphoribosyl-AMP cyclohydrolase/phosphoribosyl-ATP diphosphatase HisIE [Chloroflexota bacterium]
MSDPRTEEGRHTDGRLRPVHASSVHYGPDGLVPGVVQDVVSGEVLMVGYLDVEALEATQATGLVHFHSRSRGRLWRKGETSGNLLRLESSALDCDGDALLLRVSAHGRACHTGARSCFREPAPDGEGARASLASPLRPATPNAAPEGDASFGWLDTLWETIADRAARRPAGSYTARLVGAGVDAPARKVLEEAGEVILAAKDDAGATETDRAGTRERLRSEVADLVFHLLVLAAERGLTPSDVVAELRARHRG